MKIALCATHLEKMILPQDREYIGVDHGVEELLKQGITPKFAIGDFDSLQNRQTLENLNIHILMQLSRIGNSLFSLLSHNIC